jgi:hypothetical protein
VHDVVHGLGLGFHGLLEKDLKLRQFSGDGGDDGAQFFHAAKVEIITKLSKRIKLYLVDAAYPTGWPQESRPFRIKFGMRGCFPTAILGFALFCEFCDKNSTIFVIFALNKT